jgi:hypothetical protein
MSYQKFANTYLNLLGLFADTETPVKTDDQAATGNGNGLLMGQAAINNINKRFWIGMGKFKAPIEVSSVMTLTISGQTPNGSYNPGTLIINTVDNLAWLGTGGTGTEGSYISISGGMGGITDLDGGTF